MRRVNVLAGVWSCVGSLAVIAWLAAHFGGFAIAIPDLLNFLVLDIGAIKQNHTAFIYMVPVIFAVVLIELPLCVTAGILQEKMLGGSGKHAVREMLDKIKHGPLFFNLFVITTLEEVFARWLFLGVFWKVASLNNTLGFLVLFLLGNGIWALIHLGNYKQERDKHPLRVLPQFVAGVFFTYIFVKYGLLAAVLTHFASNALLFSLNKVQALDRIDFLITLVSGAYAATGYWLLDKPLSDLTPWFSEHVVFAIPGWSFWDYVKLSILVSGSAGLLFGVLLYDRSLSDPDSDKEKIELSLPSLMLGIGVMLLLFYFLFWLMGFVVESVPSRVIVLSLLLCFCVQTSSVSAMARTFWSSLPSTFVFICTLEALGFWMALVFVGVTLVLTLPITTLEKLDT